MEEKIERDWIAEYAELLKNAPQTIPQSEPLKLVDEEQVFAPWDRINLDNGLSNTTAEMVLK